MNDLTNAQILEVAEQLRIAYKLKKTLRYAGSRDFTVHCESVAEHVFASIYLVEYFLPLEDPDGKLDKLSIIEILLFHDFGEIINGDVPAHMKTDNDRKQEFQDAEIVFSSLPGHLQKGGRDKWEEYETRTTPESQFAYAIDKIEPLFELLDSVSQTSMRRLKYTRDVSDRVKLRATEKFPVMRRFVEAITDNFQERNLFWEEGQGD